MTLRPDIRAELMNIATSDYDTLRFRLDILDAELPRLASLVAEVAFWRCVLDAGIPHTQCAIFLIYRAALLEYNEVQEALVAMGAFLVA